jgi:hypothetical protein
VPSQRRTPTQLDTVTRWDVRGQRLRSGRRRRRDGQHRQLVLTEPRLVGARDAACDRPAQQLPAGDRADDAAAVAPHVGDPREATSRARTSRTSARAKPKTDAKPAAPGRRAGERGGVLLSGGNPQIAKADGDLRDGDERDEAELASWVKQAAALPGWMARPSRRRARSPSATAR